MSEGFVGHWVWINKNGDWPEDAVTGPESSHYAVARSQQHSTFGKALKTPSDGSLAWFPFKGKEIMPDKFEVLVYQGDVTTNGFEYEWVKVLKFLQNQAQYEIYQQFDGSIYVHSEDLDFTKKRYKTVKSFNDGMQKLKTALHSEKIGRRVEDLNNSLQAKHTMSNIRPIGKFIFPDTVELSCDGKEITLSGPEIENGYLLCIRRIAKVLVEVVPDNITSNMTRKKPATYFEERFTTSLLPQEYTFRKMYKTTQISQFQNEHEWQSGVELEYSLGILTQTVADFKAKNTLNLRGTYITNKQTQKEEETEFVYPIRIPPYTTSTLSATIWEEELDIPYKAIETVYDRFNHVLKKQDSRGVWKGVSCYVADVHIQENFRRGFWMMVITIILIIAKFIWTGDDSHLGGGEDEQAASLL
eukprot:TRINITY_DN11398_c0_g1_i1.p1 TRINITY_DN11398_c0_g1~~TRINITY_DN11398_c0_g1_i1.p1  ORF type:complete len:415 (-),score=67.97 TRINITY_DN11398_c0_g1_i1:74-1318(-)